MTAQSDQNPVWYLLNMHGPAMLPRDERSAGARQHTRVGAIQFEDFEIVGTVISYSRSRPQRYLRRLESVARRVVHPSSTLPERLWSKPNDQRYQFRAVKRSRGADVKFGLALLTLTGYSIDVAGGPFGGEFRWIYGGYRANDMGLHFWGGGFTPDKSRIDLATIAYKNRNKISEDLRRAIEINHFARFAPNVETRILLCVSALERLAGQPPPLLRNILTKKQERKALLDSVDSLMRRAGLEPAEVSRLRNRIAQTQQHNSKIQIKRFCNDLGIDSREELWEEAFKTRNSAGHGHTRSATEVEKYPGDRRIWDVLQDTITQILVRKFNVSLS